MEKMRMGWKAMGLTAVLIPSMAIAATQTMTVTVKFAEALTTKDVSELDFGVLKANTAAKYTLSPSGELKTRGKGALVGGTPKPGSITVVGSKTQNIDISAENYVTSNGVTPSNAYCAYDGGKARPCKLTGVSAPGAGKVLMLGLDIDVSKFVRGNVANPTFDVVVKYN